MTDRPLLKRLEVFNQVCQSKPTHRICGDRICEAITEIERLTAEITNLKLKLKELK